MPKRRNQLELRLEAVSLSADARWREGLRIPYLGGWLTLRLATDRRGPERVGDELHLPLPPAASPRQIRDMAEAWLRDAARAWLQNSALVRRHALHVKLVFGRQGDWVRRDGEVLRCYWRLIEQPERLIEQALARAIAAGSPRGASDELFPRAA